MSQKILGSTKPATREGFKALIEEANRASERGYDLLSLCQLKGELAAVFVRRDVEQLPTAAAPFFE